MSTIKQKQAVKALVGNGGNVTQAMLEAGYSPNTANTPQKLTNSDGWKELMGTLLSDEDLIEKHKELLNSTRVDHLVFPLGPKKRSDTELDTSAMPEAVKTIFDAEEKLKHTSLTDEEIIEMLADVNCKVRRIVHGETGRHVYFWSADNKARKEALDMAYKLKGKYAPEKVVNLNMDIEVDENLDDITNKLNDFYKGASIPSDGESSSTLGTETQD